MYAVFPSPQYLSIVKSLYLNIDNQTLVQECRSGDRDAMSLLYTRFAPRMLRVIYRYVSDKDSAQDILHDGFVAAFTRLDSLRDPERLDFWLATIMKNLSLKFLQEQSVTSILDEIPETVDETEPIETLDFATLESLIRQLPDGYQKVFRLAVLEGKSHKEISEILGIAPNSSSSQLFHAKLRLRQLIRDYKLGAGLISVLVLFISVSVFFMGHHSGDNDEYARFASDRSEHIYRQPSDTASDTTHESPTGQSAAIVASSTPVYSQVVTVPAGSLQSNVSEDIDSGHPAIPNTVSAVEADTVRMPSPADKLPEAPDMPLVKDYESSYGNMLAETSQRPSGSRGWSAGISVDPGLMSFNSGSGDVVAALPPYQDSNNPSSNPDDEDNPNPSKIQSRSVEDPERYLASATPRHYLPVSFALTAEKHFSSCLSVESGFGYSYLHTDFTRYMSEHRSDVSTCHWHYLEVPMKVNLYAYSNPLLSIYFSMGGRVAIPVYSYAKISPNPYCQSGRFGSKPVWAVGGSIGVAFHLSKRVNLFIEPSLRYHFPQNSALPNFWTDNEPVSLSIPVGFRFSW